MISEPTTILLFMVVLCTSLMLKSESVIIDNTTNVVHRQMDVGPKVIVENIQPPAEYYALGPFPIGTRELGSDVVESFGSIDVFWERFKAVGYLSNDTFPSELADGGRIKWKKFNIDDKGSVQIHYDQNDGIRWNFLNGPFGLSVLNFYSWVFGEFTVQKEMRVLVNCLYCSMYYIDGVQYAGDRYGIGYGWNAISLKPGVHIIKMRLSGMESAQFVFQIKGVPTDDTLLVKEDLILPSVVGGKIRGNFLGIPVLHTGNNLIGSLNCQILSQSGQYFDCSVVGEPPIYPGQTLLLAIKIPFSDISEFVVAITHSNSKEYLAKVSVTLPVVETGKEFIYTYLDLDNSVQYAVAMPPKNDCLSMPRKACPIIVSTHGAGSKAEWLMPAFQRQAYSWIVIPSGRRRYGYDWTGPQINTVLTSVSALETCLSKQELVSMKPDPERILFTGHSMGGHGCYLTSTRYSDIALASMCAAGWTTHEQYIPYYTRNDLSFIDSTLKGLLESSIIDTNPDLHAENLKGIPFLTRCGGDDEDVSPWHPRRMSRIYNQISNNKDQGSVSEVPKQPHWFWAIMDDSEIQKYYDKYLMPSSSLKPELPTRFTVTCTNPNGFLGKGGIQILQLDVPYSLSKVRVTRMGDLWDLRSNNVKRFGFRTVAGIPTPKAIRIDGVVTLSVTNATLPNVHFCKSENMWAICDNFTWKRTERHPDTYGPIRQVYEKPFVIVTGTNNPGMEDRFMQFALYLSNQFFVQGHGSVPIVKDSAFMSSWFNRNNYNVVLLGGSYDNEVTHELSRYSPVKFISATTYVIGSAIFNATEITGPLGLIYLSPFPSSNSTELSRLAVVVTGTDKNGFDLASSLFPSYSGLLVPDYIIVTNEFKSRGSGGFIAAGYWNNNWKYDDRSGYIDHSYATELQNFEPKSLSTVLNFGMILLIVGTVGTCCLLYYYN